MHFTSAMRRLAAIAACVLPLAAAAEAAHRGNNGANAHAAVLTEGYLTHLGTLGGADALTRRINGSGDSLAGDDDLGRLERAFIYSGGIVAGPEHGGLIGLSTLIEPAAARPLREANGASVQQPGAGGACTVSAGCQAARLESPAPIPEPSSYVMLLAGLALVVWGAGRHGTPLFVR